jgi:tRNA-dihydrouridine synthase A
MGEDAGYNEININAGCPSDRVQSGQFGACLMREPQRVAACVQAMSKVVSIRVTVKCRIGVDFDDRFEQLVNFVEVVSSAGCTVFIVHARKAWLSGLSPRQNREIPPLDYPRVYQLKARFPELTIVINGGISQLDQVQTHLTRVDGVMVGREAYQNPYRLATVDHELFGFTGPVLSRWQVLELYKPYIRRELERGVRLKQLSRHLLGLFQGQPGARNWRRTLSERGARAGAGIEVIEAAEAQVRKDGALHFASQVTQPVHFAA